MLGCDRLWSWVGMEVFRVLGGNARERIKEQNWKWIFWFILFFSLKEIYRTWIPALVK